MDRLFVLLLTVLLTSPAGARVTEFGSLITNGYSEQAAVYGKMNMHPASLEILKALAKKTTPNRKIKIRLVPKKVMVADRL